MKKVMVAVLIGALAASLAACSGNTTTVPENPVASEQIQKEIDSTPEETKAETDSVVVEEAEEAPDFSGTWTEPMTGRCAIKITSTGDNTYSININWSSSAFENAVWEMDATYYESTGLLEYENAKYYVRTYTDDETYTDDVKYEDGAGCMWIEDNGQLGWQSANSDVDGIDGSTMFEKMPEE